MTKEHIIFVALLTFIVAFVLAKLFKLYSNYKANKAAMYFHTLQQSILVPLEDSLAVMQRNLSEEMHKNIGEVHYRLTTIEEKQHSDHSIEGIMGKKGIESYPILYKETYPEEEESARSLFMPNLNPHKIKEVLDKYIVGQEKPKRIISLAAATHCKRINHNLMSGSPIKKGNILLVGPTGSGKTLLVKKLAEALALPFVIADSTQYTSAGWKGRDLEEIFESLYKKAGSIESAEHGIVFLDEIDKIVQHDGETPHGFNIERDLLSLMEGTEIPIAKNASGGGGKLLNTKEILFIFGGAFVGLKEHIEKRKNKSGMGFISEILTEKERKEKPLLTVNHEDLIKYGMMPEFVGRVPTIAVLQELTEGELLKVLMDTKDSIIQEYINLLAMDNVQLLFEPPALKEIVKKAILNSTGARGLRAIVDGTMHEICLKIAEDKTITRVVVTKKIVQEAFK